MTTVFVQFADATESQIISVFGSQQNAMAFPNQGVIDETDPRYQAFVNATATLVGARAALAAGLTITSTGNPALNGTYSCDSLSQADIIAIETSLNAGKGFPGGASAFGYPDSAGAMHSFSEANFTDFAAAVRDFVYGCRAVIAGRSSGLPPASVTIS